MRTLSMLAMVSLIAIGPIACQPDAHRRGPIVESPNTRAAGAGLNSAPMCLLVGPTGRQAGVYGADLGFTTPMPGTPQTEQVVLFGDTWGEAGDACRYVPEDDDDLIARLPMSLPDGIPRSPDTQKRCGVLDYELATAADVRSWPRSRLYAAEDASAPATKPLSMGFLRTPVAAFTARGQVYGLFHRNDPVACETKSDCPGSMTCTAQDQVYVGQCSMPPGAPPGGARTFCRKDDDCLFGDCEAPSAGYCYSRAPFQVATPAGMRAPDWYMEDPRRGLAHVIYIARMVGPRMGDFRIEARFLTNRFVNPAVRAVAHFDPQDPSHNDYRPGEHTLLIWGRSTFVGDDGFQSLPFFAYQRLPAAADGTFAWAPRFFAGLDHSGRPTWSDDEEDARPVYAGEPTLNSQGELSWKYPEFDIVNQMSLTWLPDRGRWLMFYGGDLPDFFLGEPMGQPPEIYYGQPEPGAIHLRHAAHPWGGVGTGAARARGAWTEPVPVLTPDQAGAYMACPKDDEGGEPPAGCLSEGDPHGPFDLWATMAEHATELTPEAFLEVADQCVSGALATGVQTGASGGHIGRLYAPNIIEPWTRTDAQGRTQAVYWNVSTWNPYQVILVETRIDDGVLAP